MWMKWTANEVNSIEWSLRHVTHFNFLHFYFHSMPIKCMNYFVRSINTCIKVDCRPSTHSAEIPNNSWIEQFGCKRKRKKTLIRFTMPLAMHWYVSLVVDCCEAVSFLICYCFAQFSSFFLNDHRTAATGVWVCCRFIKRMWAVPTFTVLIRVQTKTFYSNLGTGNREKNHCVWFNWMMER